MIVTHDNGEVFSIEGVNVTLGRFCSLDVWERLSVNWKLDALDLCCKAVDSGLQTPIDQINPRYKKPLHAILAVSRQIPTLSKMEFPATVLSG